MRNPWIDLPKEAPFVLEQDRATIERFNQSARQEHLIHTSVLPEPHHGDPNAPVILLNLNPGHSEQDEETHSNPDFADACRRCALHEAQDYPFYLLNPAFPGGGFDWWSKKLKPLIKIYGREKVARSVFCVELFPYHSSEFAHGKLEVSSQEYAADLVRRAVEKNALVIAMRGLRRWEKLVPEISAYPRIFKLKNPRNVTISPKNCPVGFPLIVEALDRT